MASELLKTKALAARIKEPKVRNFDFGLNLTSVESLIPDLPEPKPQELLDIQEDNRKGRLLESLNKIGGRLEDSSLDFIKRENFGGGGVTKSLGNGLYEITYKGGSKVYYVDKYIRGTGEKKKVSFGKDKQAALDYIEEFEKNQKPTTFDVAKKSDEENFKKISNKIDKQFNKVKDKGYAGIREFRKSMVDLVNKDDFRNFIRTQKRVTAYVNDKFKNIKDVNTLDTEKAMDKYYKVGGKERGVIDDLAKEFNVNSDTLKGNIQKVGRKKIPIKYGDVYEKRKAVKEKRTAAEKEFSDLSFESKMSGTKAVQKSHMDDLYSKVVRADTLGYAPEEINNVLLKDVDAYLNQLYKNRDKLLKDKPEGYKQAVEEINQKGMDVAAATDGYKSFQVEQPNGKKYQFGVEPGKTIDPTGIVEGKEIKGNVEKVQFEGGKKPTATLTPDPVDQFLFEENRKAVMKSQEKVSKSKIKDIAKKLASFGFKCSAAEGGACDNPMAYLDDIKKQQTIAKGSGNAAANAAKKLSAGKTIMREFIGPAALGFELAAAVPITYLGYKAGLPPERIVADATYGLFGDTEKARLKKEAVKAGIDTTEIQKSLDFEKASGAMQTLAQQEGEFRGPDDEMLFPQQYEKGEEDFYKAVGAFRDKAGNVSKDVYKKFGSQLQQLRDYIAQTDADTAAERSSKVADFGGIADYINYNSGGRVNYSNGSDGTDLAIKESLEAFERYLKAGGKLSYKDFIAVGGEGVSKFFNAGGRVGFADGPDNPKRRQFMKIMAGIASLPILGKFFKGAKSAKVVKLANTTTVMPDWFPAFVDKAFEKGIAKKIDADLTEIEIPELPGVKVQAHDDGRIMVEGKNAYDEPYEINYTPPGYELVDETTGKAVKTPGEFQASDTRFRQVGPELDDVDVDYDTVPDIEDIVGGNSTELEGFAKGTGETKYTKGQKAVDEADARSQYSQQERADFDQGPEIDPTDYTYED